MLLRITTILLLIPILAQGQNVQLVVPTGHTGQIQKIETDPDTTWLASIQNTGDITIWEYQTQRINRVLRVHNSRVNDILFTKDLLLSGGDDKEIIASSTSNFQLVRKFIHQEQIRAIAVYNDKVLGLGKDGLLMAWNLSSGDFVDSLNLDMKIAGTQLEAANGLLWSVSKTTISVVDLNDWKINKQKETELDNINCLLVDDKAVYLGDGNGELSILDKESLVSKEKKSVLPYRIYSINAHSKKLLITGRGDGQHLAVYDPQSGEFLNPNLELGNSSTLSEGGIRCIQNLPNGDFLIPDYQYGIRAFGSDYGESLKIFTGLSDPINDIQISNNERYLAIATAADEISIIDLTGMTNPLVISGHTGGTSSLSFHPTDSLIASVGMDRKLKLWSANTGAEKKSFRVRGSHLRSKIGFDPSGQYIIQKSDDKFFEFFAPDKSKSQKVSIKEGRDYEFADAGNKVVFRTKSGFTTANAADLSVISKAELGRIKDYAIQDDVILALLGDELIYYDLAYNVKRRFKLDAPLDKVYLHPNKSTVYGTVNTTQKNSSLRDYSLKVLKPKEDKLIIKNLDGHNGFITQVKFLKNGRFILSASNDGQIIIRKHHNPENQTCAVTPLKDGEWAVTTTNGVYDASKSAYKQMHYVRGKEKFDLSQMKDLYYEPNLLPRLLGYIKDPIQKRQPLEKIGPHPEINITHPKINNGALGIEVNNTGGGISWVVIKINGKEVVREIRESGETSEQSLTMDYSLKGHPFLLPQELNKVSVKAFNSDGSLSSPEKSLFLLNEDGALQDNNDPKLYALIVGTNDYPGQSMDLTFAAKDAEDFAGALNVVAANQYGADNSEITLLTTNHENRNEWPTKARIEQYLDELRNKARAQDIMLIYMSGHGENYQSEHVNDFLYLTCDATGNLDDEQERKKATISSRELTHMINAIPTLRQVLIFDTCHSGKLATEIGANGTMNSGKIKALEKMKDHTGLYILAGSESENVSFESSLFQQGLLTYSMLFGMRGASTDEHGKVNVLDLFKFASKKVPELASDIGQVQIPEVRFPDQASPFAIGALTLEDKEKISIVESKPIFIQSGFQHENEFGDDLHIGVQVDRALIKNSREEGQNYLFIDKKVFHSAYYLKGRYNRSGNELNAKVKLFRDDKEISTFSVKGMNANVLVDNIVEKAVSVIQ